MAEHTGFLRDIIDNPDDDVPRLIYADWLEDNGRPERAELIRVQDVLARHHPHYAPRELEARESVLLVRHRRPILQPFLDIGLTPVADGYDYGDDRGFTFHFRRGFVEALEVWCADAARQFVDQADDIFALTPLLHLRFNATPCNSEDEGRFEPLDLETLRRLLALPQLRRLRSLDLCDNGLRDDEGHALLSCPHFRGVSLYRADNDFSWGMANQLEGQFRYSALHAHPFRMGRY